LRLGAVTACALYTVLTRRLLLDDGSLSWSWDSRCSPSCSSCSHWSSAWSRAGTPRPQRWTQRPWAGGRVWCRLLRTRVRLVRRGAASGASAVAVSVLPLIPV